MTSGEPVRLYLRQLESGLNGMDPWKKTEIVSEVEGHINERIDLLRKKKGMDHIPSGEELERILDDFGPPDEMANNYKIQSIGSVGRKSGVRPWMVLVPVIISVLLISIVILGFFFFSEDIDDGGVDQTIRKGEGIDTLTIGDDIEDILRRFKEPEERIDTNGTIWLSYRESKHIDILFSSYGGGVKEIRFNEGYEGMLENGIELGDTIDRLFEMEGGPLFTHDLAKEYVDLNSEGGHRVLYRQIDDAGFTRAYKYVDERNGTLYWADANRIIVQIVVFSPVDPDPVRALLIDVSIESVDDVLLIEVNSGTILWDEYRVLVDGKPFITADDKTNYGETAEFEYTGSEWDAVDGEEYIVKIIHISSSTVVYEKKFEAENKGGYVKVFSIDVRINHTFDVVLIEVLGEDINWSYYQVRVDGNVLDTVRTDTKKGDIVEFRDLSGDWDAHRNVLYDMKVIDVEHNQVVYALDVYAE